jgi:uncharacterized protein (DUF433 family)
MNKPTDIRNQPAYTVAEAASYLKIAPATLRSWVAGRSYSSGLGRVRSQALIKPAKAPPPALSFWNLVEAHVLRSLRIDHGVSMDKLRAAIGYAERKLKIDRLLLSHELRANAGDLLLERYGELIVLNRSGQMAMRRLFDEHLARVEWDEWEFPVKLYPFGGIADAQKRLVSIAANIAFGRPVLAQHGISTATIADRIDAGESVSDLASDYDVSVADIEEAVLYERAA